MPAFDGGDDFVGTCLPDERAWFLITHLGEAVEGCLKVDDGVEDAVLGASSGWLCEEAVDGVEP